MRRCGRGLLLACTAGVVYYERDERKPTVTRPLIESNPSVMMGKPVVAGTRVTVETILEKFAAGESVDEILEAHPRLTPEAVRASLAFASIPPEQGPAGGRGVSRQ